MEIPKIYNGLTFTGTVLVYDIARHRTILEVSSSDNASGYIVYRYYHSTAKPRIHQSECTADDGAKELVDTAHNAPTYWLWEGEPWAIAYASPGNKFHMSSSCSKCPAGALQWTMTPRDFSIMDLWCKLCAREVHAPPKGKWLSPDWSNW